MDIVTFKMKLTEKLAKKDINYLTSTYGIKGRNTDIEFIRKGTTPFSLGDLEFDKNERSVIKIVTTAAKDRDDEIIMPDGLILDHYMKQPIVLPGHDYSGLGVGKSIWIKSTQDGYGLLQKTQYAKTKLADEYWLWQKDGFPMAASIGFIPIKALVQGEKDFNELAAILIDKGWLDKETIESTKRIYTKALLLEVSDVAVPSNQEATMLAVSKGMVPCNKSICQLDEKEREQIKVTFEKQSQDLSVDSISKLLDKIDDEAEKMIDDNPIVGEVVSVNGKDISEDESTFPIADKLILEEDLEKVKDIITKPEPEETDNEIAVRVRNPKDFQDDSFRRTTLKTSKPRVFAVIGKLEGETKTTVQSLRFPKDDGWTVAKASKWAKEHDFKSINVETIELLNKWSIEDMPIYKRVDADGIPSVDDIRHAIHDVLDDHNRGEQLDRPMTLASYIADLYPIEYPDGHVVAGMLIENADGSPGVFRFVDFKYIYEHSSKRATLHNPNEVQEQWTLKGLNEKMTKIFAAEMKEGRVLSKRNRSLVASAQEALSKLLEADAPQEPKDEDDKGGHMDNKPPKKPKMVLTISEPEVKEEKGNGKIKMSKEDFKLVLSEILTKQVKESGIALKKDMKDELALQMGKAVYE